MSEHGSIEIWRRIRVAVWAYAYEIEGNPLVSDAEFDAECRKINTDKRTSYHGRDNTEIDKWFKKHFSLHTGMWIHKHPDLDGIRRYYDLWKTQRNYVNPPAPVRRRLLARGAGVKGITVTRRKLKCQESS